MNQEQQRPMMSGARPPLAGMRPPLVQPQGGAGIRPMSGKCFFVFCCIR